MRLIDRIGESTIGRQERAGLSRFAEVQTLSAAGHRMAAIYFCGYVAELVIGSAYFRLLGFTANHLISKIDLHNYLKAASGIDQVSDFAHPLEGEARILTDKGISLRHPRYKQRFVDEILSRVDAIVNHWSYQLRYRSIDVDESTYDQVFRATRWLLDHYEAM